MKKFLLATMLSCSLLLTPALAADDIFYDGGVSGSWAVFGNAGSSKQNPACVAEVSWEDGSKLQLIKDLATGEIYIWFQNMEWNIADAPGNYPFRMNIVDNQNNLIGGDMTYELVNKNTISVRGIDADSFIPPFMTMAEIRFVMPGDIQNAYIPLNGSGGAVEKMLACMDVFKTKQPAPANPPAEQPKKSLGQDV